MREVPFAHGIRDPVLIGGSRGRCGSQTQVIGVKGAARGGRAEGEGREMRGEEGEIEGERRAGGASASGEREGNG